MKKLSAFMWGYWGWGNFPRELVRTVDAIERERGRAPPIFVDVRHHRGVMAKGFQGDAFEKVVGRRRYRWLPKLGNQNIDGGGRIRIADRTGLIELLQLIIGAFEADRRVIFFCACLEPRCCHRSQVARLAVKAAHWHGIDLTVVEWPGGVPEEIELPVDRSSVRKALNDAARISLDGVGNGKLEELKSLPWCSRVDLRSDKGHAAIVAGPAQRAAAGWYLPSIGYSPVTELATLSTLKASATRQWHSDGYAPIRFVAPDRRQSLR